MGSNTYTEEEFKKVLKNLFSEKKRVKELEKQIQDRGLHKQFQAKLADIHRLSLTEEYAKLKQALQDKESENLHMRGQLDKVRPALKKLVDDLRSAQENHALKEAHQSIEELKERLQSQDEMLAKQHEELSIAEKNLEAQARRQLDLEKELEIVKAQQCDFTRLHAEYEEKMQEILHTFSQKEKAHEETLERSYVQMREMTHRHAQMMDEKEAELRKAHQHLVKKVKEVTLLSDALEQERRKNP